MDLKCFVGEIRDASLNTFETTPSGHCLQMGAGLKVNTGFVKLYDGLAKSHFINSSTA